MKKIIILIPVYNDWQSLEKIIEDINRKVKKISCKFKAIGRSFLDYKKFKDNKPENDKKNRRVEVKLDFKENKIEEVYDDGYGDWMKKNSYGDGSIEGDPSLTRENFNNRFSKSKQRQLSKKGKQINNNTTHKPNKPKTNKMQHKHNYANKKQKK